MIIRSGDAIVAEHRTATKPGESLTHKQHIDELWKLALQRVPSPLPSWQLTFDHAVAATPLGRYQCLIDASAMRVSNQAAMTSPIDMAGEVA